MVEGKSYNVKNLAKITDSEDILSACLVTLLTKPQRKLIPSYINSPRVGSETQYGTVLRVAFCSKKRERK